MRSHSQDAHHACDGSSGPERTQGHGRLCLRRSSMPGCVFARCMASTREIKAHRLQRSATPRSADAVRASSTFDPAEPAHQNSSRRSKSRYASLARRRSDRHPGDAASADPIRRSGRHVYLLPCAHDHAYAVVRQWSRRHLSSLRSLPSSLDGRRALRYDGASAHRRLLPSRAPYSSLLPARPLLHSPPSVLSTSYECVRSSSLIAKQAGLERSHSCRLTTPLPLVYSFATRLPLPLPHPSISFLSPSVPPLPSLLSALCPDLEKRGSSMTSLLSVSIHHFTSHVCLQTPVPPPF